MGQPVSGAMPCPGCGKTDWCFHISEDAFICGRIQAPPEGYKRTGEDKNGRGIFSRIESRKNRINLSDCLPLRVDQRDPLTFPKWEIEETDGEICEREIHYLYGDTHKVVRRQWDDRRPAYDGKTKKIRPWHQAIPTAAMAGSGVRSWWVEGKGVNPIPLYRQDEAESNLYEGVAVLFYVAGEQAVETAREIGLTAITNQGGEGTAIAQVRDWLADLEYKPALFVIWPDHDEAGAAAAEKLRAACNFVVPTLVLDPLDIWADMPEKGDITDFYQYLDKDSDQPFKVKLAIKNCTERAIEYAHKRLTLNISEPRHDDHSFGDLPCKLAYRLEQCETVLGNRIRLNTLTNELELDGKPCDVSELRLILAKRWNIETSLQDLEAIASSIGRANQYNPVMDYLDSVATRPADPQILENLASRYFGSDDPIHQVMVKKFLIAAVARIYRPGVKVDNVLFLSGPQAYRKSTFFRTLAGGDWFDDSMGAMGDKDEVLKLHRVWFVEWAELETVFKRKEVAAVKAFLTCSSDSLRRPYGRVVERMPRRSVIVGTTNETDILKDSTGNRRYWVIPVKRLIDTDELAKERDQIWAAAVQLFRAGEIWYLTRDEEKLAEVSRENFTSEDVWDEAILNYLAGHNGVTTTEILQDCLGIDLALQDRRQQMRVAEILKRFGYAQKAKRFEGVLKRIWLKSEDLPENQPNFCNSNPQPLTPLSSGGVTTSVTTLKKEESQKPTSRTVTNSQGVTTSVTTLGGVVTPSPDTTSKRSEQNRQTSVTPIPSGFEGNNGNGGNEVATEVVSAKSLTGHGFDGECYNVTTKNGVSKDMRGNEGSEKIKVGDTVLIMAAANLKTREIPYKFRPRNSKGKQEISQEDLKREYFNHLRTFFTVIRVADEWLQVKSLDRPNDAALTLGLEDVAVWEGPING